MSSVLDGKYAVTMDMYPLQSKDFNRIYPFYEALKEGRFITTGCSQCGREAFPPRVVCPQCLSDKLEWVDLPTRGLVLAVTEQEVGVPLGFETPLVHAMVDLGGKLVLFVRIADCQMGQLKEGDEVELTVFPVDPLPVDGKKGAINLQERVFYAFKKV